MCNLSVRIQRLRELECVYKGWREREAEYRVRVWMGMHLWIGSARTGYIMCVTLIYCSIGVKDFG